MVVKLTTSYLDYSFLQIRASTRVERNGDAITKTTELRMDRLDISLQSWKAKSITEDLINKISGYYNANKSVNNFQEGLRSFYAKAKEAIDEGFNNHKNKNSTSTEAKNILNSAHNQAVKELKDWYHNGGKPREKVNLSTLEFSYTSVRLDLTKQVNESIEKGMSCEVQ